MTDGLVLPPGAGRAVPGAGMTLKVGAEQSTAWSVFEAEVTPGFDVGAHLHQSAEELFYILDGELDLLAFEPVARTAGDWQSWQSAAGARVMRGGRAPRCWCLPGVPMPSPIRGPSRPACCSWSLRQAMSTTWTNSASRSPRAARPTRR